MSKVIKIIYVYILNILNLNKILVTDNKGVKSNAKNNLVVTLVISVVYGYIVYRLGNKLKNYGSSYLLSIGFVISSFTCLLLNIKTIREQFVVNKDRDLLLSLPLSKNQIFVSKLFFVYLKSLFYVGVIMISLLISVTDKFDETLTLMYVMSILITPLIPIIVIITGLLLFNKLRNKVNRLIYSLIKILFLIGIILGMYFIIGNNNSSVYDLYKKLIIIYPLSYLFNGMINNNYLLFSLLMVIPILFIYLYVLLFADYFNKMEFINNDKKKKKKIYYKKKGIFRSLLSKEFSIIFNNKELCKKCIYLPYIICLVIFAASLFVRNVDLAEFEFFIPVMFFVNIGLLNISINMISIEKEYFVISSSLPVKYFKKLFIKILTNLIIGLPIIIINFVIAYFLLDLKMKYCVCSILLPFMYLAFSSVLGLILDLKNPNTGDGGNIRLVEFVNPAFVIVSISSLVVLFRGPLLNKVLYLYTFAAIYFLLFIITFVYLIIFNKKMIRNLCDKNNN